MSAPLNPYSSSSIYPKTDFPSPTWHRDEKSGVITRVKTKRVNGLLSSYTTAYNLSELIGSGGQGTVYSLKPNGTGKTKAVKRGNSCEKDYAYSFLWPKNAPGLLMRPKALFSDQTTKLLVMHKYDCNLKECISSLTHEQKLDAIYQISRGVSRLKKLGIKHNDIKLSNIAYDKMKNRYDLIDFGVAKISKKEIKFHKSLKSSWSLDELSLSKIIDRILFPDVDYVNTMSDKLVAISQLGYSTKVTEYLQEYFAHKDFTPDKIADLFLKAIDEFRRHKSKM